MKQHTKKIVLFIAIMLCFCTSMFAEVDSVVYSRNTDTTKVTEQQIYRDVKSTLDGLSKSLKVGAEHVYEVMVKQQYVKSFTYIVLFIVGIILSIFYAKMIRLFLKNEWYSWRSDHDFKCFFATIIGGIVVVILLCCGIGNIDTILTGFINPEYGAIQDISNLIHH